MSSSERACTCGRAAAGTAATEEPTSSGASERARTGGGATGSTEEPTFSPGPRKYHKLATGNRLTNTPVTALSKLNRPSELKALNSEGLRTRCASATQHVTRER